MRFPFARDPLFLACSVCYCANRWWLKPRTHSPFVRFWLNDLLLVPCAIPVLFWVFERLRLRAADKPPELVELAWILALWSVLFEWAGPKFVHHGTGDWRDVLMYCLGGMGAWAYWRLKHRVLRHEF